MSTRLVVACQLAVGMGWCVTSVHDAVAQAPATSAAYSEASHVKTPRAAAAKSGSRWRVDPALQLDVGFDDNVFLLSANKKDNVAAPSAAEATSGRYADMESASDLLTTLSTGVDLKGPGLMGRSLVLSPTAGYERYARNSDRSNVRLGLALQQQLWSGSRLRVRGDLTPSYFARNYLADAVDQDANGIIADNERIYARGEYSEREISADYRFPLAKSKKKHPLGASVEMGAGYYGRSYDAPMSGRDLKGPTLGARLLLDLGRRVSVDVGYDYASLTSPVSGQVLLLDEPDFGQDFNGNGTTTDNNTRVRTTVDRSRREQSLGAELRLDVSKAADVALGYEHRWRRYLSQETYDISNNGRRDRRNRLSGDLRVRLTHDLRLRLGVVRSDQNLNRARDIGAAGEIDDYNKYQGSLGLTYDL